MNFFDARSISATNQLHIRREAWASDKWFIIWRGLWFAYNAGVRTPVLATHYTADDLRATDWTTVPAALAACPITPTEPLGGSPPVPGSSGFPPSDPFSSTPDGGSSYVGGNANDGNTDPKPVKKLPPPDPMTVTVMLRNVNHADEDEIILSSVDLNGTPYALDHAGGGTWRTTTNKGFLNTTPPTPMVWAITAVLNPLGIPPPDPASLTWAVTVISTTVSADPSHQPFSYFTTGDGAAKPKSVDIANANEPGDGYGFGGSAVVT
ncbi:MAG: hypothetical protein P4L99_24120 [Chthoniobacter sp.]|nr:hypothetical protein [Chthoniobacter sp.]